MVVECGDRSEIVDYEYHIMQVKLVDQFTNGGGSTATFQVLDVNTQPGVVVDLIGQIMAVIAFETGGQHVYAIRAIGNADKLAHLNRGTRSDS